MDKMTRRRVRESMQSLLADRIADLPKDAEDDVVRALIVDTVFSEARRDNSLAPGEIEDLATEMVNEFLYLGPLQPLMADPDITEIMVNGAGFDEHGTLRPPITWVEKRGLLQRRDDVTWDDEAHVQRIMNRILARQGRRIDEGNPIEDGSLLDGSRFNGTLYPVAVDGSTFNIRRFRKDQVNASQYLAFGTASLNEMTFLATLTAAKGTILISGGTGSGKTTLLNILASFIPEGERIITIEDTCELLVHTTHSHVVRLEGRKANAEGAGEVTLEDHLKSALRKRPDRIIVGECRGSEAYTMLEAMNTGHEGSMTTIHANDPVSALRRLITLVKQGDATLSEEIIKEKIASALDCIVQIRRLPNGSRVITHIESIGDYVDGAIQHDALFLYKFDQDDGTQKGRHTPLGFQPAALREKITQAGYEYDPAWFFEEPR